MEMGPYADAIQGLVTLRGSFPALTDPEFVSAGTVDWMSFDDLVLGAVQGDESRAYPLSMMTYHHVVNDTLGGSPYLVTF